MKMKCKVILNLSLYSISSHSHFADALFHEDGNNEEHDDADETYDSNLLLYPILIAFV